MPDNNKLRTIAKRVFKNTVMTGSSELVQLGDMMNFNSLLAGLAKSLGATGLTEFVIVAFTDAAFTLNETVIKTGAVFPAAIDDVAYLEISDASIKQAGVDADIDGLRFVAIRLTGTAAEAVEAYGEFGRSHTPQDGLTADVIA